MPEPAAAPPPRRVRVPLWARVLLPLVVLGVALLIGSGTFDSSPQTVAQRAAAIEAGVRCPSCTDVSVAESNATTAIAVRHQIESMVAPGSSTPTSTRPWCPSTGRPSCWCRPTPGASR